MCVARQARELFSSVAKVASRYPTEVVRHLLMPTLLSVSGDLSKSPLATAHSSARPLNSSSLVCAAHTEFIKRLCCVGKSGGGSSGSGVVGNLAGAAIPTTLSAELLLRGILHPNGHATWNDELLGLAQTLLDTELPLSPDQFGMVVSSLDSAVRAGGGSSGGDTEGGAKKRWTSSLKFAAVLFALVRKYAPAIQSGGHKATLQRILGALCISMSVCVLVTWDRIHHGTRPEQSLLLVLVLVLVLVV